MDGQFEYLGENTGKYITFSVPIIKELNNCKTITYKLKFIDSFKFMSSSLLSLVDNYLKGFIIVNVKNVSLVLSTCQSKIIISI